MTSKAIEQIKKEIWDIIQRSYLWDACVLDAYTGDVSDLVDDLAAHFSPSADHIADANKMIKWPEKLDCKCNVICTCGNWQTLPKGEVWNACREACIKAVEGKWQHVVSAEGKLYIDGKEHRP